MKSRWIELWLNKQLRFDFIFYTLLSLGLLMLTPWHMDNIEARKGVLLNDYVLDILTPVDVSFYIMSILYGVIFFAIIWLTQYPFHFTVALKTFFFATLIRYISIYFISLEPPMGLIPLKDPVLELFVYSNKLITKDLFFSGHAGSTFLAFLVVKNKIMKLFFFFGFLVLSFLLLLQHVHYTSDIIGAVIVTWGLFIVFENSISDTITK